MKKISALLTGVLAILILAYPLAVNAEWMTTFNAGYTVSTKEELRFDTTTNDNYTAQYDFENSFVLGYRLGYWLESAPFMGFSLDVSYFRPEPDIAFFPTGEGDPPQDPDPDDPYKDFRESGKFDIIPVVANLMFRIPLGVDEIYPNGRYQPYVAFGPGLFLSWLDTQNFDDSDAQFGWDAKVGFNLMVTYNIGIFAEYRYTDSTFTQDEAIGIGQIRNELEIDLQTSHYTLGISYFF